MDEQKFQRAERTLGEIRDRLKEARTEKHFQAIGVLAREAMISLAQAVYVREIHPPLDDTEPSEADAKRMLEAYFAVELADNDAARRHTRATVDFANNLQHKRTAQSTRRQTRSLVRQFAEKAGASFMDARRGSS